METLTPANITEPQNDFTNHNKSSNTQYPKLELTNFSSLSSSTLNLSALGLQQSQVRFFQNTVYDLDGQKYQADMLIADDNNGDTKIIIFEPQSQKVYSTIFIKENTSTNIREVTYLDVNGNMYMKALWYSDNTIQITEVADELSQKSTSSRFAECVVTTVNHVASSNFWSGFFAVGMITRHSDAIIAGLAIGCAIHAVTS